MELKYEFDSSLPKCTEVRPSNAACPDGLPHHGMQGLGQSRM